MLLPEPDGPTMNVHDPVGTRNVTPAQGLDRLVPARGTSCATSTTSIMGPSGRAKARVALRSSLCRMASIGVIVEAFQAG